MLNHPFSILDYLDRLNIVKETSSEYHCTCPLCGAGGFKIDKKTGRYFTFVCDCMDTDQGKKAIIQAIAPLEPRYEPLPYRPRLSQPKTPNLSPLTGTVALAKFDVIPSDFPQPMKPTTVLPGIPQGATVTTYRYSSTQFVKRFDWQDKAKPKGRDKTFRQCHVNPVGELSWGKGSDSWPLYRESEAMSAKGWPLFLEGEECAEAARRLGLVATTLQGSNWSEEAIAHALTRLKEAGLPGIILIPDHDDPGETKGNKVIAASAKTDFPVIVIPMTQLWEDVPVAGDLADWIALENNTLNPEDLIRCLETELAQAVSQRSHSTDKPATDNPCSPVDQARIEIQQWLLENDPIAKALNRANLCRCYGIDRKTFDYLAACLDENSYKPKTKMYSPDEFMTLATGGSLLLAPGISGSGVTIIGGTSGAGKTTLAYDLAGAVIMKDEFLGEVPNKQGSVLFVSSDEPYAYTQDKLINRGLMHGYQVMLNWDVSQWHDLETAVEDMRPALIIVDSFNAIHNDPAFDENSAQASQTIKQLERLSVKYSVPVVLIHHTSKSKENKGVHKLRGSTAIAASCSSVLLLETMEGMTKTLTQPKIRGSEPLNLIVEMDVETGRFQVSQGNIADDTTKSLAQRLKDFFMVNPGRFFEMTELREQFVGHDRKVLTNALNRLVNQGHIIKRPSKVNPRFKVFGSECTQENSSLPVTPLSPSNSCVNNDQLISETIATQGLEDVTIMSSSMSPTESQEMTTENKVMPETKTESDISQVVTKPPLEGGEGLTTDDDPEGVLSKNGDDSSVHYLDWHDVTAEIDHLMTCLGWTTDQGRNYLRDHYGVTSRWKLTDEQIIDFLNVLRAMAQDRG